MKVLLDTDVLLDVALARLPHVVASEAMLDWCEAHPGSTWVAWHSLSNLFYFLRRDHGAAVARRFIQELLEYAEVVPTGTADAKHALALPMADFEDALQTAAAIHGGADVIVTRNLAHFGGSPIPARSPADFLAIAPP
jgi:predicted nucleic acid-binding protein